MNQIFMDVKEVSEKLGVSRSQNQEVSQEHSLKRSATDTKGRNNQKAGTAPEAAGAGNPDLF